jgi:flagellar biosynthesis/type III secretory pathway M-ring protein FliF/YscJ
MIGKFTAALVALTTATTPAAAFYIDLPNGAWLEVPNEMLLIGVAMIVIAVLWEGFSGSSRRSRRSDLPEEISSAESPEHYDNEATRLRALKRKLDAETDYHEAQITSARKKAELKELSEIIRHDKAKRSLRR